MEIEQTTQETCMRQLRSRTKMTEQPRESVLLLPSKKIQKRRAKYQKIEDSIRIALLEAVKKRGEKLKTAANRLKINYSSAKSILFTYRKKGRICKKTNGPCKSTTDSAVEITLIKKEDSDSDTQIVQDLTSQGSTPEKVDSPTQDRVLNCDSNSEHSDTPVQPTNVSAYLKCFSKSTSILERIKSLSENLVLESHNEKKLGPSLSSTQMSASMRNLVSSLEDLICDIQKLGGTPPMNPVPINTMNTMPTQRFTPMPHFLPHNPSLFGFQPLFLMRPNAVNNSNQLF